MSKPAPVPPTEEAKKRLRKKVDKLLARDPCKSKGSIVLAGRTLEYRSIAEFIPVVAGGVDDKRGEPEAAVFTTSYFLDSADPATRPVCFVFNGGPGSASIWLHLGALGPKRVRHPRGRHDAAAAVRGRPTTRSRGSSTSTSCSSIRRTPAIRSPRARTRARRCSPSTATSRR